MIEIAIDQRVQDLLAGIVTARGLAVGPSAAALRAAVAEVVVRVRQDGMRGGETRREAVRRLLRAGGFKPSGRNKPSQEYLLRTVTESGELPQILNAVDWLNAVSLESGLPISLLSASRLGGRALIRYGQPGEKFVFNRAGQELELAGLLVVCTQDGGESVPLGTPIKDSMAGKIIDSDTEIVAVLYGPQPAIAREELADWCQRLGHGFVQYCGAASCEVAVQSGAGG